MITRMAPLELEGNNLGEKHRTYNKLLKESLTSQVDVNEDNSNDIAKLIEIDIACENKNVKHVLNTFKSQDILYVIRAVEKSTWLITDSKYSDILNLTYLQNELFPQMTSKAKTKLIKHIKHNLKDEPRVEEFYKNETNLKLAMKWLPNCSVSFIENNIHKHLSHMEQKILKRLCEKSFTIFEKIVLHKSSYQVEKLYETTFFLARSYPEEYLTLINKHYNEHGMMSRSNGLTAKQTELLMNNIPNLVIDNFLKYFLYVHIPTFVRYLKRENTRSFLLEQVNKCDAAERDTCRYVNFHRLLNYDTLKAFIKRMPENEQFNFVTEIFIDNALADVPESTVKPTSELFAKIKLRKEIQQEKYVWYEFAPFDVAFTELRKLIPISDLNKRYSMLNILIKCLHNRKNLENPRILLKYFNEKYANDPLVNKYDFIKNFLSNAEITQYDEDTWMILDEIFKNMGVYAPIKPEDYYSLDSCVESLIIHKVTKDENVPEVVEEKFVFTTFKSLINKLGKEEKVKMFSFLLHWITKRIEKNVINSENDFKITVGLLDKMLNLLKDWNKDLSEYPNVYNKIKELIKIKDKEKSWKTSLISLYNIKKSWRKLFFEESIILHPCEEVCINALKHDPQLLTRYSEHVEKLRCNNSVSLQRVNRKLRIYWPQTLATEWNQAYINGLNNVESHQTLIRGLFTISPVPQLIDIVKKYTPKDAKVNWSETNEMELSMQRNISLNMHLSRPHLNPDMVLGYAKGDYLKYALPSVMAIYYNLNISQSRVYIPKLLDAPVSLQKHGIRFAFMKLKTEEIKEICSHLWKNSKNATIRKVLFEFTHKLLCNEKNVSNPASIWELLQSFIDNLNYEEDNSIYKLLPEITNVPNSVKGEYFVKTYKFLQKLHQNVQKEKETYERYLDSMISNTRDIMELLPHDFLEDMIQQLLDEKFYKIKSKHLLQTANFGVITILSAYVLSANNIEDQVQRYEKMLKPVFKQSCAIWDEADKSYIHTHIEEMLKCLSKDLDSIVFSKKTVVPYKIFLDICEIMKTLSLSSNYLLLTKWNLVVAFTKIMSEEPRRYDDWDTFCKDLAPVYGAACLEYLKQEVSAHFPRIYIPFKKALRSLDWFIDYKIACEIYKALLADVNFIPGYLAGIDLLRGPHYYSGSENDSTLRKLFLAHPSVEVKMHFHCVWDNNPLMAG